MEQLIVLVLDILHDSGIFMVAHITLISVTWVIRIMSVILIVEVGAEVLIAIFSVVVTGGVFVSISESVFMLSQVRSVQRILFLVRIMMSFSLFYDVFMMDLSFSITAMETSMLVSPKSLLVRRKFVMMR